MVLRPAAARLAVALTTAGALLAGTLVAGAVQAPHTEVVSAVPSAVMPYVQDGAVAAFAQVGATMVVGGSFTKVSPTRGKAALPRTYVMAFNAVTGQMSTTFSPVLDKPVTALLPGPRAGTVYVGGEFTTVNGIAAKSLVLLDLADGSIDPGFGTRAMNGVVNTLKKAGGQLYVGGTFTNIAGRGRGGLATLDTDTGAVTDFLTSKVDVNHNWSPTAPADWTKGAIGVSRLDITPDGSTMVAIGNFKQVNGDVHDQIAQWDLTGTSAALKPWRTTRFEAPCLAKQYDSYVRDVDFSPDGSYFVVVTTGGHRIGELCDTASRWETRNTPVQPTWVNYTGADSLLSTAITGEAVYVGGHQRWLNNGLGRDAAGGGGVPRPGVAALDPDNGLPLSWNPGHNPRGVGTGVLHATEAGLWMGSDKPFIGIHGSNNFRCADPRCYQPGKLVFFPLADGAAAASKAVAGLPGETRLGAADGSVTARDFNGTTASGPRKVTSTLNAAAMRGAMVVGDALFYGKGTGNLFRRTVTDTGYGPETLVDPYNDPDWSDIGTGTGSTYRGKKPSFYAEIPKVTSMFYDGVGQMFYTLDQQTALYSRAFSPDSGIIHHTRSTVPGVSLPADLRGAFLADGAIWFARRADGNLRRLAFDGRTASGSASVVSGPGTGGPDWRGTALWLQRPADANARPAARLAVTCEGLSCTADGTGSSDSDGTVDTFRWSWGDGAPASSGPQATHAYATGGTYNVTLTVTDDRGATDSATQQVTVSKPADQAPTAAFSWACELGVCTFDGTGSSSTVTDWSWKFGTHGAATGSRTTKTLPEGSTIPVTLTVTDSAGRTGSTTKNVTTGSSTVRSTKFGAVVKPQSGETYATALQRSEDKYGRLGAIRYFDGNTPDDWSVLTGKLTDHDAIVSFRLPPAEVVAGTHDAALQKWFAAAPRDRTTWFTYLHEPEDNIEAGEFSQADFRAAYARISGFAEATGNDKLRSTLVLMCYTVNPKSGRNWRDYFVAGSVETIGWDCYDHGKGIDGYGTPENLLDGAVAATQEAGVEFGVAELGSLIVAGDDGTGRGEWLKRTAKYLYDNDAAFVTYFDTNGAGTDYRLLDDPSIAAWHSVVSDQTP